MVPKAGFLVVILVCITPCAETYRILGWHMDNYSSSTMKHFKNRDYVFGDQDDEGEWFTWGDWYCWTGSENGYCTMRVQVTHESGKEHFQLQGWSYDTYSTDSTTFCSTTNGGDISGTKVGLGEGKGWNACKKTWGYKYVRVFGVWTTERPLTSAFSHQQMKSSNQGKKLGEVFYGTKGSYDTIHELVELRSHCSKWGDSTVVKIRYWNSPTTLIDFEAHFDQVTVEEVSSMTASYRTIKNEDCGDVGTWESGMTGSETDTVSVALTTMLHFSQSFSYSFDITSSVSAEIELIAVQLTQSTSFTYETSEDIETTQTETKTTEYKWPTFCPTGLRCTTELIRVTSKTLLPVTLTFKRGEDTYTEENVMDTNMDATSENDSEEPIPDFVNPCVRK